jgi:hypothetical protein
MVDGDYIEALNQDVFSVYATKGSGYGSADGLVGVVIDGKWYTVKQYHRLMEKTRANKT